MVIHFREVPHSLFRQVMGPHISANRLVLGVYLQEAVTLSFQTKNPGARVCLRSANLFFDYDEGYQGLCLEAYEKALHGLHRWRPDALELCWPYLDELIASCENCPERAERLHRYPAGSWGPPSALGLTSWPKKSSANEPRRPARLTISVEGGCMAGLAGLVRFNPERKSPAK